MNEIKNKLKPLNDCNKSDFERSYEIVKEHSLYYKTLAEMVEIILRPIYCCIDMSDFKNLTNEAKFSEVILAKQPFKEDILNYDTLLSQSIIPLKRITVIVICFIGIYNQKIANIYLKAMLNSKIVKLHDIDYFHIDTVPKNKHDENQTFIIAFGT